MTKIAGVNNTEVITESGTKPSYTNTIIIETLWWCNRSELMERQRAICFNFCTLAVLSAFYCRCRLHGTVCH